MRDSLVERLRCPIDLGHLELQISNRAEDGHVMSGQLRCTTCQRTYSIEKGVPHLLPAETANVKGENLEQLQAATVERFGFEWLYFRDWGWLAEYPDVPNAEIEFRTGLMEHTREGFWSNRSLFLKEDFQPGLTVLDAGCGNGRFTYQVAQTGAEVIGVDLGWGVYSAFDHMRALPNVHIVRGDLFRLSFPASTFDRIFSIGVLQHTGNAAAAFDAIVRTLRPGGLVAVRVYGKGRRTYEILDRLIRGITIRLPIPMQMAFAGSTAATARWLTSGRWRRRVYKRVLSHVNLLPTKHEMFDWWAAPIATHHTLSEVQSWFTKNHMEILRTRPPLDDANAQRQWLYTHYPINVLGRSSPVALHVFQER